MAKRNRTIPLLLALILAAGLFIWLQERWRYESEKRAFERARLFDIDPGALLSMRVVYSNGTTIVCAKTNGVWMTGSEGGGQGRADLARIYRMVTGMDRIGKGATISAENLETRGLGDSAYGFDHPLVTIQAVDHRGRHEWRVGRRLPLGKMLYVRVSGDANVYTAPDILLKTLPEEVDDLRDRSLFAERLTGAKRIEISGSGGFVRILREPETGWTLRQPVAAADGQAVDDYLRKLAKLRIESFVADEVSDFSVYGLQEDSPAISLSGSDGTSRILAIGDAIPGREGWVYARRMDDSSVFSMKADVLDLANVDATAFRDRRLLSLPINAIDSLSIRYGSDRVELKAGPKGGWRLIEPVEWAADSNAVAEVLGTWNDATVIRFDLDDATVSAEWSFAFGSSRLGKTNRLSVLPAFGKRDGVRVVRDGEKSPCRTNLQSVPERFAEPLFYKGRQVLKLCPEEVVRLEADRSGGVRETVKRGEDGRFVPEDAGSGIETNERNLTRCLRRLHGLSATRYVEYNPENLVRYGLANPTLTIRIGLMGTNRLGCVLLLGAKADDGVYAMLKGRDTVFLLDEPTVKDLSENWLDAARKND